VGPANGRPLQRRFCFGRCELHASKAPNKKGRREIVIHSRDHMRAGYAGGELKEAIGTSNVYEKPVDA
jgi:hypothetical protein